MKNYIKQYSNNNFSISFDPLSRRRNTEGKCIVWFGVHAKSTSPETRGGDFTWSSNSNTNKKNLKEGIWRNWGEFLSIISANHNTGNNTSLRAHCQNCACAQHISSDVYVHPQCMRYACCDGASPCPYNINRDGACTS